MNILTHDLGLSLDNIIIDTDIGGLGYGLEYGYSIMEKIRQEKDDEYLNLPLISFAAEETLKTKEAKSDCFSKSYGELSQRAIMYEITATSAVLADYNRQKVNPDPAVIKAKAPAPAVSKPKAPAPVPVVKVQDAQELQAEIFDDSPLEFDVKTQTISI